MMIYILEKLAQSRPFPFFWKTFIGLLLTYYFIYFICTVLRVNHFHLYCNVIPFVYVWLFFHHCRYKVGIHCLFHHCNNCFLLSNTFIYFLFKKLQNLSQWIPLVSTIAWWNLLLCCLKILLSRPISTLWPFFEERFWNWLRRWQMQLRRK